MGLESYEYYSGRIVPKIHRGRARKEGYVRTVRRNICCSCQRNLNQAKGHDLLPG